MENKKFIYCTDEDTAKELSRLGFKLLQSNNNGYTFLNCKEKTMNFDQKKIIYTNKLCI